MTKNVYIHVPFCRQKCKYCSFISFPKLELKEQYLKALEIQITNCYKNEILETLYFGGGTPSLLSVNDFKNILNLFNINSDTEITVELNPETLTEKYLSDLYGLGINRLSIGCQTFDNNILEYIGRKHNSSDVKNTVKIAQNIGFRNISLDFIYGLPTQDVSMFRDDLSQALELGISHISLYGLKIEEDCYFGKYPPKSLPDNDIQADMYENAVKFLKENNFEHYEISNFSKKGYNSKHNLNYWNNNSYYGFGVAAHGYEDGIRYSNPKTIEEFIKNPLKHKTELKLSSDEILEEEIFLGFRKLSGINTKNINEKFSIDFENKYKNVLKKYNQYITRTPVGYRLSEKGVLISNSILSEFLED